MQILITAGGTEEPIDGVRTISNFSTGATGAAIADYLTESGFKVTLLTSYKAKTPLNSMDILFYKTFEDLDNRLKDTLGTNKFTGIIHAAAVSDYSVDYLINDGVKMKPSTEGKIDSTKDLAIFLKPNYKIIERLKSYSINPLTVIGFKLTKNGSSELISEKVKKMFSSGKVDYVIHNDLQNIGENYHISEIYTKEMIKINRCQNKVELAAFLAKLFREI